MPKTKDSDLAVALCRFRGVQAGQLSTRIQNSDLNVAGTWIDKTDQPEPEWLRDFAAWLVSLAVRDLDEAAEAEIATLKDGKPAAGDPVPVPGWEAGT